MKNRESFWKEHFDHNALNFNGNIGSALDCSNLALLNQIHNEIIKDIDDNHFLRLLEVGSGMGNFLTKVHSKSGILFGVDISVEMLKLSKKILGSTNQSKFYLFNSNSTHLPFSNRTFNYCVCTESLQYMDHFKSLNEMIRVTQKGGKIIINFPNKFCPIIKKVEHKRDGKYKGCDFSEINEFLCSINRVRSTEWKTMILIKNRLNLPFDISKYKKVLTKSEINLANRFIVRINL